MASATAGGGKSDEQQPGEPPKKRRIAVLGISDVTASAAEWVVHAFPWSYQGQTTVVADYDVAVVNLLDTSPQEGFIARGLPPDVNGNVVLGLLAAAGRLVLSGGELVVLGRPDVHVKASGQGLPGRHWSTLPYWTGVDLVWDERAGDQIEIVVHEDRPEPGRFGRPARPLRSAGADQAIRFLPYLRELKRYDYGLIDAGASKDAEQLLGPPPGPIERAFRADTRYLAQNRHGGGIATETLIEVATRPVARRQQGWTVQHYGRVVFLPSAGLPPLESVALILREAYGVHIALPSPPWLAQLRAPGEDRLRASLEAAQAESDAARAKLAAAEAERDQVREILGVLTTRDEDLEQRVRDLLRQLGADVEDPVELNKEDGWVRIELAGETLHGVLEIKSTRNATFDESGLRQLLEWVARSDRDRKRRHKGIFIGNNAYAQPPDERDDPFSSSFRQSAEANGFVAVTTATLLRELGRVVDEGADPADFWRRLFDTRGVLA